MFNTALTQKEGAPAPFPQISAVSEDILAAFELVAAEVANADREAGRVTLQIIEGGAADTGNEAMSALTA